MILHLAALFMLAIPYGFPTSTLIANEPVEITYNDIHFDVNRNCIAVLQQEVGYTSVYNLVQGSPRDCTITYGSHVEKIEPGFVCVIEDKSLAKRSIQFQLPLNNLEVIYDDSRLRIYEGNFRISEALALLPCLQPLLYTENHTEQMILDRIMKGFVIMLPNIDEAMHLAPIHHRR